MIKLFLLFFSLISLSALGAGGEISFTSEAYKKMSGCEKRDLIWEQGIEVSEFTKLPKIKSTDILGMILAKLTKKMTTQSDVRPKGWKKYIHRRAVVAKIEFQGSEFLGYTGLWRQPSVCGLLRLSLTYKPNKRGFAPGIAIKLFVDGEDSRDISLLTGLDSHGQNYNFFAKPFTNIVPLSDNFGAKLVSKLFKKVSPYTNYLSIDPLAEPLLQTDQRGKPEDNLKGPRQIFVQSHIQFASSPSRDFREDFLGIDPNSSNEPFLILKARPDEQSKDFNEMTEDKVQRFSRQAIEFAQIKLTSKFIASKFGDDRLFFRHYPWLPAEEKVGSITN